MPTRSPPLSPVDHANVENSTEAAKNLVEITPANTTRVMIVIVPLPTPHTHPHPPPLKGRASLENLQAEADRISAQVASPVADKLSAGGRLSEAFGRGRDGVLKAVGGAGRAVDQGVSAVSSRSAVVVDGLPTLKGQASGLSARVGCGGWGRRPGVGVCFLVHFA